MDFTESDFLTQVLCFFLSRMCVFCLLVYVILVLNYDDDRSM